MSKIAIVFFIICVTSSSIYAQRTKIMGFMDLGVKWNPNNGNVGFVLGEQDLFINADISDKISFLGESVFKFTTGSSTKFAVGLERAVIKYNYKGNHNISIGRFHTPVNYWNDSYHHGRVFFPTVGRPETFNNGIIPIHTVGIQASAQNLGNLKFGYNVMVGNGLGSSSVGDNDDFKSLTMAAHFRPKDNLRIGGSMYVDRITDGSKTTGEDVRQRIYTASVAYFKKYEVLAEYSYGTNATNSLGMQSTHALYVYAGYKIKDVLVPYFRFDFLEYDADEMFYNANKTNSYTFGVRYEINYLSCLKLEYQIMQLNHNPIWLQGVNLQCAIGFSYD